jgi:asparagine synthase (glutamine-hydrolysing)
LVAKKYNTRHHTLLIRSSDLWEQLPEALDAMDSPSGDGINTYIISKAVSRQGIKVALSGVGGDELFTGYPIFDYWRRIHQGAPVWPYTGWIRKRVANWLPQHTLQQQRRAALLRLPDLTIASVYPLLRQVNTPEVLSSILATYAQQEQTKRWEALADKDVSGLPVLSQLSYAEYMGYTRQTLLKDMDQMSMASSLELREPYFDHELVEWVLQIPDSYKIGSTPKPLFVKVLGDLLPAQFYSLPKRGFVLPAEKWFRQELRSFCADKINQLAHRELFHTEGIMALWNHFLAGKRGIRWSSILQLIALENYLERHQLA